MRAIYLQITEIDFAYLCHILDNIHFYKYVHNYYIQKETVAILFVSHDKKTLFIINNPKFKGDA